MCSVVCSLSLFDRQQTLRKCGNISKGSSYSIQVTHLTLWNKKWPDFCIQLTGKIRLSSNDRFYIPEVQLEDESGGIYSNKWTLKGNGNSSSTLTRRTAFSSMHAHFKDHYTWQWYIYTNSLQGAARYNHSARLQAGVQLQLSSWQVKGILMVAVEGQTGISVIQTFLRGRAVPETEIMSLVIVQRQCKCIWIVTLSSTAKCFERR